MGKSEVNAKNYRLLKKIILVTFICYFLLAGLFYYLSGEQLHFRQSRGNIDLKQATSGSIELIKGSSVEEEFVPKIQIFQGISVQMGNYMRENSGTVTFKLTDMNTNEDLLNTNIPAGNISNGEIINLQLNEEREDLYGHKLKLSVYSDDAISGQAVSPLINSYEVNPDSQLYFNKQAVNGTLCYTAYGKDVVWTGKYYKEIVIVGAIFLLGISGVVAVKVKKGKKSYLLNLVYAIHKYEFLIRQLVSRDFKTKYKRSILGVLWSFLNPLFTMAVQYFVFSTIFKSDIEYYHIYLLIGVVMFNYFSEACLMALTSVISNTGLITKVYIPKYIYPLSKILSSTVNLFISLVPLFAMILISKIPFSKSYFLLPFVFICLIVFCLGLGMLLSALMVYFRDTQFLWGIASMLWMYATPIFYPESILPNEFRFVLECNPMYYFIKFARTCIIDGISPEPISYIQCFLFSFFMLMFGSVIFKKSQDNFILNL